MDSKHVHVPGEGALQERGDALEEAFFARRNRELIEKARAERAAEATADALAAATGIRNDELLGRLLRQGVTAETMVALSLVPLVAIAWADGSLEDKEREAISRAAADAGITESAPAHGLLQAWMDHAPGPELVDTWKSYIRGLVANMEPAEVDSLRQEVLQRAHDIAFAAGGFLGIGAVNWMEKRKLEELEQAFDPSGD